LRRTISGPGSRVIIGLAILLLAGCGSRQASLAELGAEELWIRGVEEFADEDWGEAIRYLDRYTLVGGSDPRVYQARYYVAQAHFNEGEYVTAATEASRLAGDLGRLDLADDARFLACDSYRELSPRPQLDQEYTRAALEHCAALVDYFPDSEFADPATEIVNAMWSKLAEKVFEAGDWYQRRRAYDSAIIYFEEVADAYPNTVWAPRALGRMIEVYGILEYEEDQAEARQRLLQSYPDSDAAREHGGA
jgi:outer membrane protein assembly factor BamD